MLSNKQQNFTKCIGLLIAYASAKGYGLTFGDAYRDKRVHGEFGVKKSYAHKNSVHKVRLAVDFNLFVDGSYIQDGDHPAYIELGNFWKSLDNNARWGGDWEDASHFSFEYAGAK